MPVLLTYEIKDGTSSDHNRVQSFLERLGWESLGGSAYRYPKLGTKHATEDWFNHVVPALALFRAFAIKLMKTGKQLKKFSLDVQSSTGCNPGTQFGTLPQTSIAIKFSTPNKASFGLKNLKQWIDGVGYPY